MMNFRVRHPLRHLLLLLAALMFVVGAVLEAGIVPHTAYKSGPFAEDSSGAFLNVPVPENFPGSWWVGARSDRLDAAFASSAKLWINHIAYDKPHSPHRVIASGRPESYSHWYGQMHFALPAGVPNDASTVLRIEYPLQWRHTWAGYALMATSGLVLLLLRWCGTWRGTVASVLELPSRLLLWLGYGMAAILAFYVLGSLWALSTGSALPTAAMLRQNRSLEWLARTEWTLPYVVMSLALLAAAFEKISGLFGQATVRALTRCRTSCERMLHRWDVPLLIGWSIISVSVIWTGFSRPGNYHNIALLGLIPWGDARDYFIGLVDQSLDGVWKGPLLFRPLASAARGSMMLLSAYSYQLMILLQASLFGIALAFAARAVSRYNGIWSGLIFACFICIVERPYLTTALTETLGLIFVLLAVPFITGALRWGSRNHALIALTFVSLALMVRMGSMFLVPLLAIWIILAFAEGWRERLRVALQAAGCLALVMILNNAVKWLYSGQQLSTAANFAYSLCGLSIGGSWQSCFARYESDIAKLTGHGDLSTFLYGQAVRNIFADPLTFIGRLASGMMSFATAIPNIMFTGQLGVPLPAWWPRLTIFVALLSLGTLQVARCPGRERLFWVLVAVGVMTSSAFVFFDEGLRVMIVAYPFIALLLVAGLALHPRAVKSNGSGIRQMARNGAALIAVLSLLMIAAPGFGFLIMNGRPTFATSQTDGERLIIGGRHISGVLVISDGTIAPAGIPSMQLADFVRLIKDSHVEQWQGIVTPEIPRVPFGFISAPRAMPSSGGGDIYIVPPEVVEQSDVPYWLLRTREWYSNPKFGRLVHFVTSAKPLYPAPQR